MRYSRVLAVPIAGSLALLLAAVTIAASGDPLLSTEPGGAESISLPSADLAPAGPLMAEELFRAALGAGAWVDAREVVGRDTIRYRVCKDLTICYLEVPAPLVSIAVPVLPPDIGSPVLIPVEVFATPTPTEQRWALLGLPLLGLAGYGLIGDDEFAPAGQGGGGGGPPPAAPPGPEPPRLEPPGSEPPGSEPPGPRPPGPEPPGPRPPGPPIDIVPEPTTLILLCTGFAGLVVYRRLRRRERENQR